jgi:hypothetical protein
MQIIDETQARYLGIDAQVTPRNSKAATMNGMLNRPAKFKKHLPLDCSTLDFLALVGR